MNVRQLGSDYFNLLKLGLTMLTLIFLRHWHCKSPEYIIGLHAKINGSTFCGIDINAEMPTTISGTAIFTINEIAEKDSKGNKLIS